MRYRLGFVVGRCVVLTSFLAMLVLVLVALYFRMGPVQEFRYLLF